VGVTLGPEAPLSPGSPAELPGPWWRRSAERFVT
jgi:hypothetical protein